tara:strand:- start:409737 stop:411152 length:1416 start_codon:yes stop_codon:yes gene_type:complete
MDKNFYQKLSTLILLVGVLVGFNQCVTPMNSTSKSNLKFQSTDVSTSESNSPTGSSSSGSGSGSSSGVGNPNGGNNSNAIGSVQAFSTTVHPITRARCVNCHGSFQPPLHAVADSTQAHNEVMDTFKVDMNNIPNSRLVQKLRSGHNCWSDCNTNGDEMEAAITEWKALMTDTSGGGNNTGGGSSTGSTSGNAVVTADSNTLANLWSMGAMGSSGLFTFEANMAILNNPMVAATENGYNYIWTPNGNGGNLGNNNNAAGRAYINFQNQVVGDYRMFALVDAPNNNDNSFHMRVNQGNYAEWHIPTTSGFEWREVTTGTNFTTVDFPLSFGNNVLEIRQREDGTKISQIVLSDDPNINPDSVAGGARATITYDLTNLLGYSAQFIIDVQDYDTYSYKFTNPRIIASQQTRVETIYPLVNGSFNPQHSTYSLVGSTVMPNVETLLNDRALIVLKDQGPEQDRVSFSFEILSPQ